MTCSILLADERYWRNPAIAQMRREHMLKAERFNGRLAMPGFVALIVTEAWLQQGLLKVIGL